MKNTEQNVFYVSPNGNDSWSGNLPAADGESGPFATLTRARDAVRSRKAAGALDAPITVMFRGGTYFLDDTVVFGPEDSGTRECPVNYVAYPGETPVFSGGLVLEGEWQKAEGDIMSLTLKDAPYFRQLTVNGQRKTRSRTPNEGYFMTDEALSATSFRYKKGDITKYRALEDAEIVLIHSWNESRLKI